ncbi:Bcr/CflA family efflux MFS transporter [Rubrivivax rivuli]|uniref:Bcr/CflA family efflux transporter n=1 Tax=Rubrivivax rivuli TaxID=1862385 RepID=A0A437RAU3_9BURK|nr:Bcr/CflA family efflux MFS transporter [Rubrivivax rivuli]
MPLLHRSPPRLITLTLLTALSALTLNMLLPSLPSMARDLAAREAVTALVVSGYMLASAVCQLVLGPLSDRLGRRPVMLGALAAFALASLGCMLAQDVAVLLACRVMQAVIVAGAVVSSATIRDQHSAVDSAAKLSLIASAMAVAPMLGPLLGGVLDVTLGWRSVFALYALMGAALWVLVWADMGETRAPGLPAPRWADAGALLQSPRYWAYVLCTAFSVGAFYVFVTGVPYVGAAAWGLSPAEVGLGVGSITGGFLVGAAFSARRARRLGTGVLLISGRVVSVVAVALALAVFAAGISHPVALFGLTVFVGLGNGLTLPSANAGTLSVRPALAGTAAGLSGALAMALGAVLSTLTAVAVERSATPTTLLVLIMGCVLLSLAAALVATRLERAAARVTA